MSVIFAVGVALNCLRCCFQSCLGSRPTFFLSYSLYYFNEWLFTKLLKGGGNNYTYTEIKKKKFVKDVVSVLPLKHLILL